MTSLILFFFLFKGPGAAPAYVVANAFNSTTIKVNFGEVPELQRHGIITKYGVRYGESWNNLFSRYIENKSHEMLISNRKPNTRYLVRVLAFTAKGEGPYKETSVVTRKSQDVNKVTEKTVPFPITNVRFLSNGKRVK